MANAYSLFMPFLDDSPAYAHGVEFGMLYARLRGGQEDVIDELFTLANQDQVLLAAGRLGWHVELIRPLDGGDWFRCRMRRG